MDCSNIVVVLERRDRVDEIDLWQVNSSALENVLAVMQKPFPALKDLRLSSHEEMVPVLPDLFLGGSAPRLLFLELYGIPFPGLPNLLLSATRLVNLQLWNIPHSGYISPDTVVTALSTLTSLQSFILRFRSHRSHPDLSIRRLPPPTRSVLLVLTYFSFKGVCEYLDDFVAFIDTPRLHELSITFFNDIIFDIPQLIQFISRTPTLKPLENAHVVFGECEASINFSSVSSRTPGDRSIKVGISCRELDWQVSSLEQICTPCLSLLSTLENLYIHEDLSSSSHPHWQHNIIENMLWLELLRSFTTMKNLYLSEKFARRIVPALREPVESRTTEVLPILQNIFLEKVKQSEPVLEGIQQFVAMRQVTGHRISVSYWRRDRRFPFPRGE